MTEDKKKATKKEVVETNEAAVKPAKKVKSAGTKENQDAETENPSTEEVAQVVAEEPQTEEETVSPKKAEVVETVTEVTEEKNADKIEIVHEPVPEPGDPIPHELVGVPLSVPISAGRRISWPSLRT